MPVLIDDPLESGCLAAGASTPPPCADPCADNAPAAVREIGGPAHPEPTRYGDWELRGRCIDF